MKLAIDPGHGMSNTRAGVFDPGAEVGVVREAVVTLTWALTLKAEAVARGLATFITRPDQTTPAPVNRRAARATSSHATHFLSIHCNEGGGHGVEVFYRDEEDKVWAAQVLKAIKLATGLPEHGGPGNGLKLEGSSQHSRLAVLNFGGPACLVEIGFIDNTIDRTAMLNRDDRIEFADAIVDALIGPDSNAAMGG